jgi:hypothetical protein
MGSLRKLKSASSLEKTDIIQRRRSNGKHPSEDKHTSQILQSFFPEEAATLNCVPQALQMRKSSSTLISKEDGMAGWEQLEREGETVG